MGLRAPAYAFALSVMLSYSVASGPNRAAAECDLAPAQTREPTASYHVLVTFAPETPPERITEISHKLGIAIEQRMFDRIVLGRAPASQSLTSVKEAARGFPEVLAVERSSRVTPQ